AVGSGAAGVRAATGVILSRRWPMPRLLTLDPSGTASVNYMRHGPPRRNLRPPRLGGRRHRLGRPPRGGPAEDRSARARDADDAKPAEPDAAAILAGRADDVLRGPRDRLGPPWTTDHRTALPATILTGQRTRSLS